MTQAIHKSGELIYIEVGFRLVFGSDGKPVGALASAREATARFNHDRAAPRTEGTARSRRRYFAFGLIVF